MIKLNKPNYLMLVSIGLGLTIGACQSDKSKQESATTDTMESDSAKSVQASSKPLVSDIYTADPSAHVFDGKIYIYPSHDIDAGVKEDDEGAHFAMRDYHILSMDSINGKVTDHGISLISSATP